MDDLQSILDTVDSINDARSLARFAETVQNDPFGEPGTTAAVMRHIAEREKLLLHSDAEGERAMWAERIRGMAEALSATDTKGSGVKVSQRIKGGRRVPMQKKGGFDLPSSGSTDGEWHDSSRSALSDFVETYIRPNLSEGYMTPSRKNGTPAQLLSGDELIDKYGLVPPDAGTAGMAQFLFDAGDTGAHSPEELSALAGQHGISKAALSRARGAAQKRARADAAPKAGKPKPQKAAAPLPVREETPAPESVPVPASEEPEAVPTPQEPNMPQEPKPFVPVRPAVLPEAMKKKEVARGPEDAETALAREWAKSGRFGDIGGKEFQAELKRRTGGAEPPDGAGNGEGEGTSEEKERPASAGSERFLLRTGALAGLGLLQGITSAFGSGAQFGNAAGALVSGVGHMVTGAAGGLEKAGESALSLLLAPFGKTGSALSHLAGGLGEGLVSLLGAGTGIAAAGVKIGVSLFGGILAAKGALLGAGAGALLGGIAGSILPGAGTLAGTLLGAGIGSAVVGTLTSALAGLMGTVSSALGQAMSAIGDAFGRLGTTVGDALSSIKDVLSDLIDTSTKFANAAIGVSRTGNLGLGAGAQVSSLASILTGSPDGLNSVFSGFGNMSQFKGSQLQAFGVAGATGTDPMGDLVKAANAYAGMDSVRRQLLVQGGYGGNAAVGNLFAMNAVSPGLAAQTVAVAQKNALTPQEAISDYKLSLNLAEVQSRLDRLKTQFLTDLMPAITMVMGAFTRFFSANEGKIVRGLESMGEWLYVKFPSYLGRGMNALFVFGEAFATHFPKIFALGLQVLTAAIQAIQKIAGEIGGNFFVKHTSPTLAAGLTSLAQMDLNPNKIGMSESGKGILAQASKARAQADALDAKYTDPGGGYNALNDRKTYLNVQQQLHSPDARERQGAQEWMTDHDQRNALRTQADTLTTQANSQGGLQRGVDTASADTLKWLQDNRPKANTGLRDTFGTEEGRQKYWNAGHGAGSGMGYGAGDAGGGRGDGSAGRDGGGGMPGSPRAMGVPSPAGRQNINVNASISLDCHHDIDVDKLHSSSTTAIARQWALAEALG